MKPIFKFAIKDGLDDEFLPRRGDSRSTGWDVRASETLILRPTETVKIPLGIRCFAPDGWWLEIRPRSSTFAKKHLSSLYGVIDESYEGELLFACRWIPSFNDHDARFCSPLDDVVRYYSRELTIEKGERIGQLVPVERREMMIGKVTNEKFDEMCKDRGLERGAGGFGSTG